MEKRIIANNIIFAEVEENIAKGKSIQIPLLGVSMYPFLRENEHILTLSPLPNKINIGDIFLFRYNGMHLLHRLIKINGEKYIFRGDGSIIQTEVVDRDSLVAMLTEVNTKDGKPYYFNSKIKKIYLYFWQILFPFRKYTLRLCRKILK